jgi:APA family basic amino acid/polyamine antiporter
VFFAFIGFDEIVTLSEETRDPRRTIPRALLLALGISTVLYMLVAAAAVSVVPWPVLAASERPLAEVIAHDWGGRGTDIVAFVALASTTNTTLLVLTAASRLIFSLGREGLFPRALTRIAHRGAAPYSAALVAVVLAMGLTLFRKIEFLASATDLAVYVIFVMVNASLITLRLRGERGRSFRAPLALGAVPVTAVAGLITTTVLAFSLDREAWLVGAAILGSGGMFWVLRAGRAAVMSPPPV